VEARVKELDCEIQQVWNSTLMHEDDLQPQKSFPQNYTTFVNIYKNVPVREQLAKITKLPAFKSQSQIEVEAAKYLPRLEDFGFGDY